MKNNRLATIRVVALKVILTMLLGLVPLGPNIQRALAAPGDLLATVTLPGNGASVGGTFAGPFPGGTFFYIAPQSFFGGPLGVFTPPPFCGVPPCAPAAAILVSAKNVVDAADGVTPVAVSAVAWDPSRNRLWGAASNAVWLIDIGDPAVAGNALATFQFNPNVGGSSLVDGLAYDSGADTLWYSPDVNQSAFEFGLGVNNPLGLLLNTVSPKNAAGVADGSVSGVVVGLNNTLYVGRNGFAEIRRVDEPSGNFVSQFATTSGRVEDLTCDQTTYAPLEAILAKDAFNGLYEAFEVEPGTCPQPGGLDHFKWYDVRPADGFVFEPRDVTLVDQFETTTVTVLRPDALGNPADKNAEGISNPFAHLTSYQTRDARGTPPFVPRNVIVKNQFGDQKLEVRKRDDHLWVPSLKRVFDGVDLQTDDTVDRLNLDHFKCYRTELKPPGPFPQHEVWLKDQFGWQHALLKPPTLFCNPVEKRHDDVVVEIKNPQGHLTCYPYQLLEGNFVTPDVVVFNQFGEQLLDVLDSKNRLCVPSVKCPINDTIVDADGTASAGNGVPAAVEVSCGATLTPFPAAFNNSGLDLIDSAVPNGLWDPGDDLMVEGTTFCPTGIRDAVFQAGSDCVVLDPNGSLVGGEFVACDVELGGCGLSFFDTNGNGAWDNGEDIVLDGNGNGIFD